jgi:predicted hotdog family 3-hydroxylacyl-ACP dehydratase
VRLPATFYEVDILDVNIEVKRSGAGVLYLVGNFPVITSIEMANVADFKTSLAALPKWQRSGRLGMLQSVRWKAVGSNQTGESLGSLAGDRLCGLAGFHSVGIKIASA